jgi:dolichol-phosphate mannosyltransferase
MRLGSLVFGALQAVAAVRVLVRLAAGGETIPQTSPHRERAVTAIVPVLDEQDRLGPALEALSAHGPALGAILVVDGGSRDATHAVVERARMHDPRIRWVDASPVPQGWNGKAWGLASGLAASEESDEWIATIDADVRTSAALLDSLVAFARRRSLDALSVATRQDVDDLLDGLLHPALLATLVYRYGRPGTVAERSADVQANGQCFLARRSALAATGAFDRARDSRCEDITVARILAGAGFRTGFFETDAPVNVQMYASWRETLRNWPRSLPAVDRFQRVEPIWRLFEAALVQAAPLLVLALGGRRLDSRLRALNAGLLFARLGVLAGMRRAYRRVPPTYWLSPLLDAPALVLLVASILRRDHSWRGRLLVEAAP